MKTDTVVFEEKNKTLTATISCEIDHHTAKELREKIDREIFIARPNIVVLDFSSVDFMDSSGIAVVLCAYSKMRELEGKVHLINIPSQARRVLDAAGLDRLVSIAV